MNSTLVQRIEMLPWCAFGLYWLVTSFRVKTTKSIEPVAARVFTISLLGLVFALLFSGWERVGWLNARFLVEDTRIHWLGVFVTYAGVGIAIWARTILGSNWSARVGLKEGHELIRSGPYAYVRHPIYTGLLLAVIGTALIIGEWRGLVAIVLVIITHALKAKREEALMISEFGERYQQYRGETGFLFPRL